MVFCLLAFCPSFGCLQAAAFPVGLDDVDAVGNAVEQRARHAFVAKDLSPVFDGQVGGEQDALAFINAADSARRPQQRRDRLPPELQTAGRTDYHRSLL